MAQRRKAIGWRRSKRIRALWNQGDNSHSDIAIAVGVSVEAVAEFLGEQVGYPGLVGQRRTITCSVCGVDFEWFGQGAKKRCSAWCETEATRRRWHSSQRNRRGIPGDVPKRQRYRGAQLTPADKRVLEAARREAQERGTTRAVVLEEWKFRPERQAT